MENECTALIVYAPPPFILFMVYFREDVRATAKATFAPFFGALSDTAHRLAAVLESEATDGR